MITLNRTELLQSLKEACKRKETTMTNLSNQLHVQKNTLSSWFSEQSAEVPFNNLVKLARILNDESFIESVKDYMFGYNNHLSNITNNNVAAIYLRQQKEEHDRIVLTPELEEVLSINDDEVYNEEIRSKALRVYKELFDEVDIEIDLQISFKNKFNFTEKELRKLGVINNG